MAAFTQTGLFNPHLQESYRVFSHHTSRYVSCSTNRISSSYSLNAKFNVNLVQNHHNSPSRLITKNKSPENRQFDDKFAVVKLIKELTGQGLHADAVRVYLDAVDDGLSVHEFSSFPILVKAIGGLCDLRLGRQIHGYLIKLGALEDTYVVNSLLSMLWKCGAAVDAIKMFEKMRERDIVSWNAMISGFHLSMQYDESLSWFTKMVFEFGIRPDRVACLSALSSCASTGSLSDGKNVHAFLIKNGLDRDEFVATELVGMYMKFGCIDYAEHVFKSVSENARKNTILWNVMILGYVNNGLFSQASSLFMNMIISGVEPNSSTMVAVLVLCSNSSNLALGMQIHALLIKFDLEIDVRVRTALIDMYFNSRNCDSGLKLFERSRNRNLITWGTVISNCARCGYSIEALDLYRAFRSEHGFADLIIVLGALRACSSLALKPDGMEIHVLAVKTGFVSDTYVSTALIDMYAKTCDMKSAETLFLRLSTKDIVSWSALISGYSQNEFPQEALESFQAMVSEKIEPNAVIISSILNASAHVSALSLCKGIHGYIIRHGFENNVLVNNSLIFTYAKCGNMKVSLKIFDIMKERDLVSWNSVILGLGFHGYSDEMIFLFFEKMKEANMKPDHSTFTTILSSCSHTGRINEGRKYFKSMIEEYKLEPSLEQYTCMVDLLGRAGYLNEAYDLIISMPCDPDDRIWGSLLGSCRLHGNEQLAELVAGNVFELDPKSTGYRVLLANLYKDFGKWDDVDEIRSRIKELGLSKNPGCSWIDVNGQIHVFKARDRSHRRWEEVYDVLESLTLEIASDGYILPI